MALLESEIKRIKYELGYNVLLVGAEPWVGVSQLFEQVVGPYTHAGASTTSSTPVTAVAAGSGAALASLTLADADGFHALDRVVVDVDDYQEAATVRGVSGSVVTLFLSKAHSGTYPVTVEGGESLVREVLSRIRAASSALGDGGAAAAGVKQVDEIEFFGNQTRRVELEALRSMWRDELAMLLGVPNLRTERAEAMTNIALM